jgi:hypothetical protein
MCSLAKICLILSVVLLTSSVALADSNGLLDCSNVIPINCGDTIEGDNTNSPDNVDQYGCPASSPFGPEDVYEVNLVQGDVIQAQVATDFSVSFNLILLSTCDEADCLEVGLDRLRFTVPETGTYFLVVDPFGFNGAPYTLSIDCISPEPPPANDTCVNAACLPPGQNNNFAGSLMWATNEFGYINCGDAFAEGTEVFFKFGLTDGNTFSADVTGDVFTDVALYIITDCENPAGSCVAGSDSGSPGMTETISFTQANGGPTVYYLIVKEWMPDYQSSFFTGVYSHDGLLCDDPVGTTDQTWGSLKATFR